MNILRLRQLSERLQSLKVANQGNCVLTCQTEAKETVRGAGVAPKKNRRMKRFWPFTIDFN